jgi:DNA polymerase III epsilon subunit-like protein
MKEKLLRFRKKQKYLIFDYETCNLNLIAGDNKPWQLAFVVAEGNRIIEKQDYWLKWDDLNVSPEAAKITGFSKTKYNKKATDPQKALDHLETYLYDDDYIKVGHNLLGFDVYMHNLHRRLINPKAKTDHSYLFKLVDTLCLAKAIKKQIKFNKEDNFLAWQYRLSNLIERGLRANLKQCCKDYDIEFDSSRLHDALYDIKVNYEVFKKMIWDIEV